MLNNFPGTFIQLIGVIKARGDLSAVTKRKDVDARIRSLRIGEDSGVRLGNDALRLLGEERDKVIANLRVIVPDFIGNGWQ